MVNKFCNFYGTWRYIVYKNPPLVHTNPPLSALLICLNSFHTIISSFFKIHHKVLPSKPEFAKWSPAIRFLTENSIGCFYLFRAWYMPCTSHPSWFEPEVYCKNGNDSVCVHLSVFCLPTFQNGTGNKLISYCGLWHLNVLGFLSGNF